MERVTKRIDGKHACYQICEKDCPDGITKDNPACVCSASRQAMEKLLHYEDLEEQGRLLELPCTVGDTVYEVQSVRKRVQPLEIVSVYLGRMKELFFNWELKDGFGIYKNTKGFGLSELGKTVFLTKEEAEQQLEKLNLGFSGGVRC